MYSVHLSSVCCPKQGSKISVFRASLYNVTAEFIPVQAIQSNV